MTLLRHITTLLVLLAVSLPVKAITPAGVMRQMTGKLGSTSGISGHFSAKTSQGTASGNFKMDGRRTSVDASGGARMWFDGKTLWTVNPQSKEVTVSTPEPGELRDANPMLYLHGYEKEYRLFFSRYKEKGKYRVLLNPVRKNSEIKAIDVTVNAATMLPERMVICDRRDNRTTVTISGLQTNRKFGAGDFIFPASKYKGYEIVDLR